MMPLAQMIPNWAKSIVHQAVLRYRQSFSQDRCLPGFIIIGAQKAGTTSLYHYLAQHPDLIPSRLKEVHFFDGGLNPAVDTYQKGPAYYRAHFPRQHAVGSHQLTFEATPLYLFNPLVPQRIAELMPQVKLIAILRNPAERAISHYFHMHRNGRETLPLLEALQAEEGRLQPVIDQQDFKNASFIHHSYKSRGRYHEQACRYLEHFPQSQLLWINSDAFFARPQETLRRIFNFLNVDSEFHVPDLQPRNTAKKLANVAPEIYDYLHDYFRPHNQALYELVGEDYRW